MAALQTTDLLVVQPSTGDTSVVNKTKISTLLSLASASTLDAVLLKGNTSQQDILLKDGADAPSITLDSSTGAITSTGLLTVGTGDNAITLDPATGDITANDINLSAALQAEDLQAGDGATAILLDGSTGQVGSSDDSNFMDGGSYSG